jgi:hypothetical protein
MIGWYERTFSYQVRVANVPCGRWYWLCDSLVVCRPIEFLCVALVLGM